MKDAQGIELKIGDRIAFKTSSGLLTGTIIRIRLAKNYGGHRSVVKVSLDKPVERYERGTWAKANGEWEYLQGAPRTPLTTREVYGENNIIIIPAKTI